jgi:hypothetical protein
MSKQIIKITILTAVLVLASLWGCSSNNDSGSALVDPNGLTKDINDIVPDSLLQLIKLLGMPVNTGGSPPNIQGAYLLSQFILDSTNIANDYPVGTRFADYNLNFTNQNYKNLTVNIDYVNGGETGNGIGSYIVGKGSDFSVFSRITSYNPAQTDSAYILFMFSGSKSNDGLHDMYVALFMLDDLDDPSNYFIENGSGRIFYDSDGFSTPISWTFPKLSVDKADLKPTISSQKLE